MRVCRQRPIQFSGWAFQLERPFLSWAELQAASMWASNALAVFCRTIFVGAHHSGPVQTAVGLVLPLLLRGVSRMGVAPGRPDWAHRDAVAAVPPPE